MKFVARTSSPLHPIAKEMRTMTQQATEFWAATAFLSLDVIDDILAAGLESGTRIRLLVGTFGNQTRKRAFRRLMALSKLRDELIVKIWDCGRHRNLHAKIYLWKFLSGTGAAWVGSPNLTVGGLQAEGEVAFELRGPWRGQELRVVCDAFEAEWRRSTPLDEAFVGSYEESKRTAPDLRLANRRRTRRKPKPEGRTLLTSISHYFGEGSAVAERVEQRLEGSYDSWVRHSTKMIHLRLQAGDHCLVVDRVVGEIFPGSVVDTKRDGRYGVFAYDFLLPGDGGVPLNRRTLSMLERVGLPLAYPGRIRAKWLEQALTDNVIAALKKARVARRSRGPGGRT